MRCRTDVVTRCWKRSAEPLPTPPRLLGQPRRVAEHPLVHEDLPAPGKILEHGVVHQPPPTRLVPEPVERGVERPLDRLPVIVLEHAASPYARGRIVVPDGIRKAAGLAHDRYGAV